MRTSQSASKFTPSSLVAVRDIEAQLNISRSHWHELVKGGKCPPPAVKVGSRFTRWRWSDIEAWLADPQGWMAKNDAKRVGAQHV